jgi:hypothetical protein
LGRDDLDPGVDRDPIPDDRGHDPAGQLAGSRVGLDLGQVALQDGRRRPLTEVGLEDRREGRPSPGSERPDAIPGGLGASRRH